MIIFGKKRRIKYEHDNNDYGGEIGNTPNVSEVAAVTLLNIYYICLLISYDGDGRGGSDGGGGGIIIPPRICDYCVTDKGRRVKF